MFNRIVLILIITGFIYAKDEQKVVLIMFLLIQLLIMIHMIKHIIMMVKFNQQHKLGMIAIIIR